jgi:hypothetical protein
VKESRTLRLKRGQLQIEVRHGVLPLDELTGFAERRNPKRAFLFVSKLLGRHIPVSPQRMASSYRLLVDQLPADLPQPVVVVGMAETAVGLGAGVQREIANRGAESLFLPTTRHPLGTPLLGRFEEPHSHASTHLIHAPLAAENARLLMQARTLLVVDDEATTGVTIGNLTALLADQMPALERVAALMLIDWSGNAFANALPPQLRGRLSTDPTSHALLHGHYRWQADPAAELPVMPEVDSVAAGDWPLDPARDWGRLGSRQPEAPPPAAAPRAGEKILVVGCGEHVWRPFLLAESLMDQGAEVEFCATTRSPIATGLAIRHALAFHDPYGLGMPNYLYNVDRDRYQRVLLCSETPEAAWDRSLIATLRPDRVVVDGES